MRVSEASREINVYKTVQIFGDLNRTYCVRAEYGEKDYLIIISRSNVYRAGKSVPGYYNSVFFFQFL